MKQPGFSVIELMISITISAFLMTTALTIYQQISKGMIKMQHLTNQDIGIMILKNRLNSDMQGLCPLWFSAKQYTQAEEKKANNAKSAKQTPAPAPIEIQDPNNPDNGYLFAQSKNNQLQVLTFVTTNALPNYPDNTHRCVRVTYVLKQDPHRAQLFLLQRKEEAEISTKINVEKSLQGSFHTILKNITSCKISYGFIEKKSSEKTDFANKKIQLKWVDNWPDTTTKENKQDKSLNLPNALKLIIGIQENSEIPPTQHELYFPIIISNDVEIKSFAEQRQQQAKNSSPTTPPAIAQPPTPQP